MSESFRHGRLPLGEVGRRFRARYRRWWHPQLANPIQKLRWRAHRFKELTPPRHVTDPDDSWRCCDDWQRILAKKLNSRIFAERAGVGVPKLLASGRHVSRIPFESLPRRFVLKPCFGGDCHGVYVMVDGREAFRQIDLTPHDLGRRLAAERWSHWGNPLLVEELIQDHRDDGPLPTEYNCFMFGSRIAAIRVLRRRVGTARTVNRFYSPEWEAFEHNLFGKHGRDARCDAPARLDELLRCAAKIGRLDRSSSPASPSRSYLSSHL